MRKRSLLGRRGEYKAGVSKSLSNVVRCGAGLSDSIRTKDICINASVYGSGCDEESTGKVFGI